ncbi:T9SS type A sorting domain-containing protein [Prevotella sp. KH2C16]|uniref:T9SS type A sorting domain-containing protein n=1 Tax=Prevotella sp. KH2C16 TaxID=1855325 RepID=UPI0008F2063C|nr:T9SS type A sorting domain-containing protein [Prevotella sp. KH2C16]SFF98432.1 Por secretion system C-terminal sorting domain-containing protein [Prevotella sp. KH2C16]
MTRYILSILFSVAFLMGLPTEVYASQSIEIVDNDFNTIAITLSGSVLKVSGANGQTLQIYNVAGIRVMSVKVDGDERNYDLNLPKGCYIVKVGKMVRKVSIR